MPLDTFALHLTATTASLALSSLMLCSIVLCGVASRCRAVADMLLLQQQPTLFIVFVVTCFGRQSRSFVALTAALRVAPKLCACACSATPISQSLMAATNSRGRRSNYPTRKANDVHLTWKEWTRVTRRPLTTAMRAMPVLAMPAMSKPAEPAVASHGLGRQRVSLQRLHCVIVWWSSVSRT